MKGNHLSLSKRERETVCLAIQGYRDKEIAKMLGISLTTVRHYWQRILAKTKTDTRNQAIYILCCNGELMHEQRSGE